MSIFSRTPKHEHTWKVTGALFHPPVTALTSIRVQSTALLRQALYGMTVVTQQCETCGWVSSTYHSGKVDLSAQGKTWAKADA